MEYRRGCLRRLFGGAPYIACGLFAMTLLPISLYRDCRFMSTVRRQATWWPLRMNPVLWTGHACVLLGLILVIASFRILGLWTTLLGDFFRIHEYKTDVRRCFPYTWFHHPLYWGSTFIFFGISLVMASQAGLVLTLLAMMMYRLAMYFEHANFCRYHHGVAYVTAQQQTGESAEDQDGKSEDGISKTEDDNVDSENKDGSETEKMDTASGQDIQNLGAARGEIDDGEGAAPSSSPPGEEGGQDKPKVKSQGDGMTKATEAKKDR